MRRQRLQIRPDFVADVAIGGDPVGADDGEVDHAVLHQMTASVIGDDR